jgi:hypothetical protein
MKLISAPPNSLSALGGGEGWGEVGDFRSRIETHLTLRIASQLAPSLSPLKGGEGLFSWLPGAEQRGQFLDTMAVGEGVEALVWLALRKIGGEPLFQAPRQVGGWDVPADLAAERQFGAAAAAGDQVIALDLRVALGINLGGEEADVADIMLGAGIRGSRSGGC